MSQIEIRPVNADDHAAWLPLWQAYLRFYNTELPDVVSQAPGSACSTRTNRPTPPSPGLTAKR